tara:strand:- start:646 stop:1176 length:531 start_codon:yes stop_codon:yes gene_type:complete
MDVLTDFTIPIIGLKLGEHSYKFNVDRQFFKEFDNTDIQDGCLQVDLILKKRSNLMELMFRAKGSVNCLCDRCGDDLRLPLDHQEMRIVKFSQEDFQNTDDVLVIGREDHEINVSHIVYETIFLGLPIRKFHDKEINGQICDEEVIIRLKEYQKKVANKGVDDRWAALKKLLTDKD